MLIAIQALGVLVAIVWSGLWTFLILMALKYTRGLNKDHHEGLDMLEHKESAYDLLGDWRAKIDESVDNGLYFLSLSSGPFG